MKYIDAEKLIAEIERLKGLLIQGACAAQIEMETNCKDEAYNEVLSFITYLQQEQSKVDLEKEIEEYFKGWTETDEGIACHYQYVDLNTCSGIARHFYEFGKARKEE